MMRKILLVLSLAFAIVMLPCVSFADDDGFSGSDGGEFYQNYGLRWSGYTHDGEWSAALAKAPDSWYAAVLACGGNPALLTPEVRSKLSDPSYGGAFYTYATTFYHIMSQYEIPEWVPLYVLTAEGLSDFWHGDFGDTWLWQSEVPNILASAALVDFNKVIKGEDVGGGGSGSPSASLPPGDYYEIDTSDAGMYPYPAGYEVNKIYLSVDYVDAYLAQFANVTPARKFYVYVRTDSAGTHPGFDCVSSWALSGSPNWYVKYDDIWYMSAGVQWFLDDDNNWYYAFLDGQDFQYAGNGANTGGKFIPALGHYHFACDFSRDFPVVHIGEPDGVWPQYPAPVTPDPPEVPTPTPPTETVDPDPTAPTITWPTAPTLVLPTAPIVVETPEGIDYTELLTLINDNLNSIDAYLQNFYTSFNSFRSDFLNGVDDIVDGLRNIYQYLGHLNNLLEVHCKHITDQIEESVYNLELYLKRLFEWLPRQLDFDAQYDDSAVTALLRRILNKIPGGSTGTPITYKPNPQSDEPSFWDWLADLFNRILQKLLDLLPDEMIQLGQLFGELINLFPFSIPWDLFALLALFGHEPVTPVIDIPWGYGGSSGQVMMIRIDLHAWDGVAEMVRPVFLVLFCLQLALLSRDLLKIINVKNGGD